MPKLFLQELIKRELEFKMGLRKLLGDLTKEIDKINSNNNIMSFGFNIKRPLFDFIKQNKVMLLNDDYDDINKLCNLVDNALEKDKRMYTKNEVNSINVLYEKILKRFDENINYLKNIS